jgi:hypothetical protein
VDSLPGEDGGCVLVDAEGLPGVSVTIRFPRQLAPEDLDIGERVTVEGQLVARHFPGRLIEGERFKGVLSVEIRGARIVKP